MGEQEEKKGGGIIRDTGRWRRVRGDEAGFILHASHHVIKLIVSG